MAGGLIKINELANQVFVSKRQLERIFLDEIGIRPKDFTKIIRFQKILSIKQKDKGMSLTSLAYEGGYSDQAHFIRDFKYLCHCSNM